MIETGIPLDDDTAPTDVPHFDPHLVLILGALSDIAVALARRWAMQGHSLLLAGRDLNRLRSLAEELTRAHGVTCMPVHFDALAPRQHRIFYHGLDPRPGIVVCAFGYWPDQLAAQDEPAIALHTIDVNYGGAVSILEEAARDLEHRGAGIIIGLSSVAGDRGRAGNYFHGSAKAGFTAFLSGLRHRLFRAGVQVLTVKLGHVRTRMTQGLELPPSLTADPDQVARAILRGVQRRRNTLYVPRTWWFIMLVVRNLPEFIFKRIKP